MGASMGMYVPLSMQSLQLVWLASMRAMCVAVAVIVLLLLGHCPGSCGQPPACRLTTPQG